MDLEPDLQARWRLVAGDGTASLACWTDLVTRWSEDHRRYHGLGHLLAVLAVVDAHADTATDVSAVRLAGWFHDAVYDPLRSDNEERSAVLAGEVLPGVGSDLPVQQVQRLVLLTVTHEYDEADADAALLCDADLAVLAVPPAAYVGYANAIRAEYAHLSDPDFRTGRSAVLRGLLERPRLYGVPELAAQWEEPARANLAAELSLLQG